MKKTILSIALLSWLIWPVCATQHLPLELNFSDPAERAKWTIENTDNAQSTTWFIGQKPDYAYGDDYMLYITNDGGVSQEYDAALPGYSYTCSAYYPLDTLPAGKYNLEFVYRGVGNANFGLQATTTPQWYSYSNLNRSDYMGRWWRTYSTTFTSDGHTPYYIKCTFTNNSSIAPTFLPNTGYAIDAIRIYPVEAPPACAQKPQSLQWTHSGNDAVISWLGNASEYQLEYFMNDTSAHMRTTVDNIASTSYTLRTDQIPEGDYTFRVRSICGRDTSGWSAIDYQLVYDVTKHCMDYLDLHNPDVQAQYGWYSDPWANHAVYDNGFTASSSRHTIHHYPRDVDPRTDNQLRTFPEGQPAAVRLGNWNTNSEGEAIVYTMDVTEDMSILQLRYALVMQLPNHTPDQQPRFTLEFLQKDPTDQKWKVLDSCGFVDFTASANLEGWNVIDKGDETNVIWKDWSLIGLNMRDYIGETVKVRVTTRDCSEGKHFGYAYFTMGCSSGKMQGIRCGEKPQKFTVEEGFYYRWYHKYDPAKKILGRDRTFDITDPADTATYCVDMMNMLDTTCYFTLEASALAFIPHAEGTVKYVPANCENWVQLSDSSSTQGVYFDEQGQPVTITQTDGAEEIVWDLGIYGTYTERSPKVYLPASGDTLHVTLHAYMENRTCEDTKTFDLVVPAVGSVRTVNTFYFCHGSSYPFEGQEYTEEKEFTTTLTGSNGCDSVSVVAWRYLEVDSVHHVDTICSGASMVWNGMVINQGGDYDSIVKCKLSDCDSVIHILHLYQQPYLEMQVDYKPQYICQSGGTIEVPFVVTAGDASEYDLLYSDLAKSYGYTDRFRQTIAPTDTKLVIPFSGSLQTGVFDASIVFHNLFCDSLTFPITMAVYYDPDSLITQRWNDFLAVRKTAFDAEGGFTEYQWYQNDEPLVGQTGSQLYLPEEGLDPYSTYTVELTRGSDSMRVRACAYTPKDQPNTVTFSVYPTVVSSQAPAPLRVQASEPAQIRLYSKDGVLLKTSSVPQGDSQLEAPAGQGLYLLHIQMQSGEQKVRKIIVL